MEQRYLYGTAVPILLDGTRLAGRVALFLYTHHGLDVHWFGRGWHPLLAIYAKKHAALPFTEDNDGIMIRLLRAFVKDRGRAGGIPALIPCSPEAVGFLSRVGAELDEEYVLLELPSPATDPIQGLLRSE